MLYIVEKDMEISARTLKHDDQVFHKALRAVLNGEQRFHVKNDKGEDYDLVYRENNSIIPDIPLLKGKNLFPPHFLYDENDREMLYFDMFETYNGVIFNVFNEYSVVLTKIVLKYTDKEVYCSDERIYWFTEPHERLHVANELPDFKEVNCIYCGPALSMGYNSGDYRNTSATPLFCDVFLWQWLSDIPFNDVKYVEIELGVVVGIGGVLAHFTRFNNAFAKLGWKTVLKPGGSRYHDAMLEKYFNLSISHEDSDDTNTIYVPNTAPLVASHFVSVCSGEFDTSILSDKFTAELKEYCGTVLGGRRVLGILLRGTDYIASKMTGTRQMATVDEMLPLIHEWMESDGYDKIFLATEDQDILDKMRAEFRGKIIAIAQERHRVSDFKDVTLITDLEKQERSGAEYEAALEDTTVNYFYALYMLSQCESFICSGHCNGWDVVNSFNNGRFKRCYKFQIGVTGNPATEKWKVVRPINAGVFARAVYPEDKCFFMTFQFELDKDISPEALQTAWKKTCEVYPYMAYAVQKRNGEYHLVEDPLSFVYADTEKIIEPTTPDAHFHAETFCYHGKILNVYIDHTLTDGMGCRMVFETFFYYYFCAADAADYPVPEGVCTAEGGVPEGIEADAFTMVEPVEAAGLMGKESEPFFALPEVPADWDFDKTFDDCSRYVISVPSSEFMTYAKSVKGSPMSVLAQLLSQSALSLHPENKLPVNILLPVSVRKAFDVPNSLLNQVVHATFSCESIRLKGDDDNERFNSDFRAYVAGFAKKESLAVTAGVYGGIIEGMKKAVRAGMADVIVNQSIGKSTYTMMGSYIGTIRTGEYGSRIKVNAFHAMPDAGVMVQMLEAGGVFYMNWHSGFDGRDYVAEIVEHMKRLGMEHAEFKAV